MNIFIYLYITLGLFFVKVISSHYIFVKKILSFISEYISSSLLGDVWESPCALWELPLCGRSGMFVRKWANKSRKCLFAQIVCTKYIICCIWDPCMCILALLEIKGVEHWLHWANNIKAKALEAQKPCFVSNFSMSVWTSPFCPLFSPSHVRLMFHVRMISIGHFSSIDPEIGFERQINVSNIFRTACELIYEIFFLQIQFYATLNDIICSTSGWIGF